MTPFLHTAQGLELQIGTNHFGHFLFTQLLLDKVKMTVRDAPLACQDVRGWDICLLKMMLQAAKPDQEQIQMPLWPYLP